MDSCLSYPLSMASIRHSFPCCCISSSAHPDTSPSVSNYIVETVGRFRHSCQTTVTKAIMQTCPYNVYPLTPHFYIVKLGFTGVFIFFLIFALKHRLWVLVRTASVRRL